MADSCFAVHYITDRRLSTCSNYLGESFCEVDRRISTASCSGANKENNIPTASKNCTNFTGATTVFPAGLADHNVAQAQDSAISSISESSAGVVDRMNKDSLVLTELLDSSDDEWANTSVLDINYEQKVSSTSTSTAGSRISSEASRTCSQKVTAAMPSQDKPNYQPTTSREINNFNSSFNYPQRTNTIPNNGNDSKLQCSYMYLVILVATHPWASVRPYRYYLCIILAIVERGAAQ